MEIQELRKKFRILSEKVHSKPLVYLDNAASTQKPQQVIDALVDYYEHFNSNIHRGVHHLSQLATQAFELSRTTTQHFIHAKHPEEIIFTKGATESINLVAKSFGEKYTQAGDEIIISTMEHHANLVPWQMLCQSRGLTLKVIPISDKGEIALADFEALITSRTKLISIAHVSNVLGTVNPIKEIIDIAHKHHIFVMIDGAQAVAHTPVDVQALDCDFYAFSSHKMYGPMGVGILYGKKELLENMPPYQYGGEMIAHVDFEKTTFNELPYKFEAGTPNVADVIAFKQAMDFMTETGISQIEQYEQELLHYATDKLLQLNDMIIYGNATHKAAVISFNIKGIHHADLGTILDQMGIAIRTGHHCAEPLINRFQATGMARASFAVYNTFDEIDTFIEGIKVAKKMLS